MKNPIVLIHVRQGFVVPLVNDPSIVVCIHDEDTEDNQAYIDLMAEFPAFNRLTKSKTFEVANEVTPTAVESLLESPAPIDWEEESNRMNSLREKAVSFIESLMPEHGWIALDETSCAYLNNDDCMQWDQPVIISRDGEIFLVAGDLEEPYNETDINMLETCVLVWLAAQIQEAGK